MAPINRERKRDEQAEQPEHRAFDDSGTLFRTLGVACHAGHRDAVTHVLHDDHGDEQSSGECDCP